MPIQRGWRVIALCLFCLLSVQPAFAQGAQIEKQRQIVTRLYAELFSAADFASADTILAPSYVNHGYGSADLSRQDFMTWIESLHAAMPDFKASVEVLLVEDTWAASRVRFTGTFTNAWTLNNTTYKPNGKPIVWMLNIMHRFENGVIAEDFTAFDYLALLQQMDASPLPAVISALVQSGEVNPIEMPPAVTTGQETVHREALTHVINDALNNGDYTAIDTYMAADYRTYEPFGNFTREQFKGVVKALRTLIPDLHVDIPASVAEGDWLAARLVYTGTFSTPLEAGPLVVPATNKPIRLIINVFVHFNTDGIGFEDYKEYNRLGWLVQAGIIKG